MSSRILKYELNLNFPTDVHKGQIVLAGVQHNRYFVWVDINSYDTRRVRIFSTGETADSGWTHVYSFQDGEFVWHVFSE